MEILYGGIEAGGTKFVCVVGTDPEHILAQKRFPTTQPSATLAQAAAFFKPFATQYRLAGVGIGAFGPLDLNPASPTFGFITSTPKLDWAEVDLCGSIERMLGVPVALDTDVNAAALSEHVWVEANTSLDPLIYITVGTGVGVGVIVNGKPLHGLVHPEGGHAFLPHDHNADPFAGVCPYHGDCLEGLASGPALAERWGMPAEQLPVGHPGWALEAHYLALSICNLIYHFSPRRVVLGGGVLQHPGLLGLVRAQVLKLLNGYVRASQVLEHIDTYLTAPVYGQNTGVFGALALARLIPEIQTLNSMR